MPKEPDAYAIRTMDDFFDVPEDRQAAMLVDLELWLTAMRGVFSAPPEIQAAIKLARPLTFRWHDDGEHDMHIRFHLREPEADKK